MLILTRRTNESIYIGEQVTITVLGVMGNQVRFGIEAPRNIIVDRAEIHERKKRQQALAAGEPVGPEVPRGEANHVRRKPRDGNVAAPVTEVEVEEEINGNVLHEQPEFTR